MVFGRRGKESRMKGIMRLFNLFDDDKTGTAIRVLVTAAKDLKCFYKS